MKNAIILQGAGETQESFWLPYLKTELTKVGYEVWLPQLPENDTPQIAKSLPFVLKNGKFNSETVIIAHSAGCPLALAVIEHLQTPIKQAILVAGYWRSLPPPGNGALQAQYDWDKIKRNVQDIIFIHSDNDPWGCDEKQGKEMFDKLGGTLIIKHNAGHMGSVTFNQPYKEFPLLVKLITSESWGK